MAIVYMIFFLIGIIVGSLTTFIFTFTYFRDKEKRERKILIDEETVRLTKEARELEKGFL